MDKSDRLMIFFGTINVIFQLMGCGVWVSFYRKIFGKIVQIK